MATEPASTLAALCERDEEAEEVRSAMEWAQVRTMAADGVSQREIAARLGITAPRLTAPFQAAFEKPKRSWHFATDNPES